jgi:NAD(P)-dependent dehydrogenase (short-subunit alcohol dehydrogenase family)
MTKQAPFDFSGKTVLVTGASRGIGAAIAAAFRAAGATVYACARNVPLQTGTETHEPAQDAAEPRGHAMQAIRHVAVDVREPEAIDALIARIEEETGRLDVVVSNAGGAPFALAADVSPRFTEAIVRLNLVAPLVLAQRANAVMQRQSEGGVLLFIGSVSALRPSPGTAAYGAAKAGVLSAVRSLAVEWAPKVRVCAVSPSLVATASATAGHVGGDALERVAATVPAGRLATPDDVAAACLFLASPHASYASGSNLVLEGGGEVPAFLAATSPHEAPARS